MFSERNESWFRTARRINKGKRHTVRQARVDDEESPDAPALSPGSLLFQTRAFVQECLLPACEESAVSELDAYNYARLINLFWARQALLGQPMADFDLTHVVIACIELSQLAHITPDGTIVALPAAGHACGRIYLQVAHQLCKLDESEVTGWLLALRATTGQDAPPGA